MTDLSPSPKFKVEPDSANPLDSPLFIDPLPRLQEREELITCILPTFPQTSRKRTFSTSDGPRKRSPTFYRTKASEFTSAENVIDVDSMSDTFSSWNHPESREQNPQITIPFLSRRSSDGDQMHHQYAYAPPFEPVRVLHSLNHLFSFELEKVDRKGSIIDRTPASSSSSGSSSLSGAMGPTPPSPPDESGFQNHDPNMPWDSPMMNTSPHMRVINQLSSPMMTTPTGQASYSDFNGRFIENHITTSPSHANFVISQSFVTPDGARSPHLQTIQGPIQIPGSQYQGVPPGGLEMPNTPSPPRIGYPPEMLDEEILRLRARVHQLENVNLSLQQRNLELERKERERNSVRMGGQREPLLSALPHALTPEFKASWKARTDARVKRFCSLNRAGNALCAWHDSRRERRAYPPRLAPPGYLNCGCTKIGRAHV